jgi:hypothetical protein
VASGAAQALQKRAPAGFSRPQLAQVSIRKAYDGVRRGSTAIPYRYTGLRAGTSLTIPKP